MDALRNGGASESSWFEPLRKAAQIADHVLVPSKNVA
jgi:hypothetical protein